MSPAAREARTIARLAGPVVATQLGGMMLGVVDNLMLGHYSVEALSASSLGRVWVFGTMMLAEGVLHGLDPIFSQAHGARDRGRLGAALQTGLVLALLFSLPVGLLWLATGPVLVLLGQDPQLAAMAGDYALARLPGLPMVLSFVVLRGWMQGRGIVRPAMWAVLVANVFNVVANWLLIFGNLGCPRLGVAGAGLATAITQVAMVASLLLVVRGFRLGRGAWAGWERAALRGRGAREIAGYGLPIALQFGLEIWAFQIATLWAGELGTVPLASHTIALNLASVSFMVPLGVSIGATTRVGNLIGARRPADAQRAAWVSLAMGCGAMAAFALCFVLARYELPALYSADAGVIALAASILPVAAAFQVFDGTQVVGGGILRGMGRTRPAAVMHLVAFYGVGLPLSWLFAFRAGLGLVGIWWGLAVGLAVVALALTLWIARRGPAHA